MAHTGWASVAMLRRSGYELCDAGGKRGADRARRPAGIHRTPMTAKCRSTLSGVADRDAENAAIRSLYNRRDPVALRGERRLYRASSAVEPRDLFEAAHDVDMRQCAAGVLA